MFKEYRKKKNLTQEKLAEILNMSTRQWQRIENNECLPSLETIKLIIKVLDISNEDIIKYIKDDN